MTALPPYRRFRTVLLFGLLAASISCGAGGQPTAPEVHGTLVGAAKPVQVKDTDPAGAEQGTIDLQVHVFGSGFEDPARVRMLLDGDTTGVVTSEVAEFVSDRELITTITVAEDATVALWDVEVELLSKRRKGIGIEMFEVKEKCLDPDFCNPGHPGVGKGGEETLVSLSSSYSTAVDQEVGEKKTGNEVLFEAKTEHKINYQLDLPAYGGDDSCASSGLSAEESAADFWAAFVASQNDVTWRSYVLRFRLDGKDEGNRTRGFWNDLADDLRGFEAGSTTEIHAMVAISQDEGGNDVYTLTGGVLNIRILTDLGEEKGVTCPNTGTFTMTARR